MMKINSMAMSHASELGQGSNLKKELSKEKKKTWNNCEDHACHVNKTLEAKGK